MDEKITGPRILAAGLLLGALADALLRQMPWGANFALWGLALIAVTVVLAPRRPEILSGGGWWLVIPAIYFAGALAWRGSLALVAMNMFALGITASLVLLRAQGGRLRESGLVEYAVAAAVATVNAFFGPFVLALNEIDWKQIRADRWPRRTLALARGVLLGIPPIVVFGALFMSADPVFADVVKNIFQIDFSRLVSHVFIFSFFAWTTAGYLRGTLNGDERKAVVGLKLPRFSIGLFETATALGIVDLLFLAFVLIQVKYLFGGAAHVQATIGLSYAEYARRGFFELVTVAALSLPMLLATHWLLRRENPRDEKIFGFFAAVQVLLLYVIMASAFVRMRLYQQEFGLSEERVYATAFMAWLAVVFAWFLATAPAGRRSRFAFGALVAGYALIAALHALNPDALIARTNVARALEGKRFDVRYAASLGADAVPELVAALPSLPANDRCVLAARILRRWSPAAPPDWRAWNRSRAEALRVINLNRASLKEMACEEKVK